MPRKSANCSVCFICLKKTSAITNTFDAMGRLKSTELVNQWGLVLEGSGYDYEQSGLKTNLVRERGLTTNRVAYAYDKIGQLTAAVGRETNGAARLNENSSYGYDGTGNLAYRTNNTLIQTFNNDSLNQISDVSRSGTLTVSGTIPVVASNVAVNGHPALVYRDATFASSNAFALTGNDTFTVTAQDTYGRRATNNFTVSLPATVAFIYDPNGNLTNDGLRSFEYDGDNQLTAVQVTGSWRAEFGYDPFFRLLYQTEKTWQGGQWVQTNQVGYVYDGNVVVQERNADNLAAVSYTRGLDLSGSLQGAGGIGGLLARTDANGSAFYHTDGSGNVTSLVNERQDVVARYLYAPFGGTLSMSGPLAVPNRYRFSSKEFQPPSGLYYYGFRFYEPNLQRWINQDPLGEVGGINLFRFVGNNPINSVDPLGLEDPKFYRLRMESKPGDYFYPGRNPGEGFWDFVLRSISLTAANPSFQNSMAIGGPGSNFGGALNQNLRIKCPPAEGAPKPGDVMKYKDCLAGRTKGSTLRGHHVPQAKRLEQVGIDPKEGTVVVMEGSPHTATRTFGSKGKATAAAESRLPLSASEALDLADPPVSSFGSEALEQIQRMNRQNHPGHF
jgi:RHS repeat-associated protein